MYAYKNRALKSERLCAVNVEFFFTFLHVLSSLPLHRASFFQRVVVVTHGRHHLARFVMLLLDAHRAVLQTNRVLKFFVHIYGGVNAFVQQGHTTPKLACQFSEILARALSKPA